MSSTDLLKNPSVNDFGILKTDLDPLSINLSTIYEMLQQAVYLDEDGSFYTLGEDFIDNVFLEIYDFQIKFAFKAMLNVNGAKYGYLSANSQCVNTFMLYLFYGYKHEIFEKFVQFNINKISAYTIDDYFNINNYFGPNIKEIIRPLMTQIKMKHLSGE